MFFSAPTSTESNFNLSLSVKSFELNSFPFSLRTYLSNKIEIGVRYEMFKNFDAKASTSYDEVALKLKGEIIIFCHRGIHVPNDT